MRIPSVLLAIAPACSLVVLLSACGASGGAPSSAAPAASSSPGSTSPGATTTTAIDGRWTLADQPGTAITFTDGEWSATSSCTTGAVGGRGVYTVLSGSRLHIVRTATPIRGCPIGQDLPTLRATTITAIARAASFRIRGDTLTLFDGAGAQLGSLVRG